MNYSKQISSLHEKVGQNNVNQTYIKKFNNSLISQKKLSAKNQPQKLQVIIVIFLVIDYNKKEK